MGLWNTTFDYMGYVLFHRRAWLKYLTILCCAVCLTVSQLSCLTEGRTVSMKFFTFPPGSAAHEFNYDYIGTFLIIESGSEVEADLTIEDKNDKVLLHRSLNLSSRMFTLCADWDVFDTVVVKLAQGFPSCDADSLSFVWRQPFVYDSAAHVFSEG